MSRILYGIVPMLVFIVLASIACVVAYFLAPMINGLPINKVISITTQIFLIVSIFPVMRYLKLTISDLGFNSPPVFFKQMGQGFLLGFITLMPVFLVLYVLQVNVIDETQQWTASHLMTELTVSLLLALLISMLEEPLFRGLLLSAYKKKASTASAIFISAIYYAALHFLTTKKTVSVSNTDLLDTFQLLFVAINNLFNPAIFSAFLALLMVGLFLGLLKERVNAGLGVCIGCHTAWVWQIKVSKAFFNTNPESSYLYLVSTYDGVIGPLVTAWLLLAILGYWFYRRFLKVC